MRRTSKPADDTWARLIREQLSSNGKRPHGDGWLTLRQVCKAHGIGLTRTGKMIRELIAAGKLEVFKGSEPRTQGGAAFNQTWYRPKK